MSTDWYLECTCHEPPISSDVVAGLNFQLAEVRDLWRHRQSIATFDRLLDRTNFGDFQPDNAAAWRFIREHLDCVVRLRNEHGEIRPMHGAIPTGDGDDPQDTSRPAVELLAEINERKRIERENASRVGIVHLGFGDLETYLDLPDGMTIVSLFADPERRGVSMVVRATDLEPVGAGCLIPVVPGSWVREVRVIAGQPYFRMGWSGS